MVTGIFTLLLYTFTILQAKGFPTNRQKKPVTVSKEKIINFTLYFFYLFLQQAKLPGNFTPSLIYSLHAEENLRSQNGARYIYARETVFKLPL